MADKTNIEWCDSTVNPWTGCTKVSPGCDHCYAEAWAKRSGTVQWGPGQKRRRTTPANWRKPLRWNERGFYQCRNCGARNEGEFAKDRDGAETWVCQTCKSERISKTRRRVFSSSLADWLDLDVEIGDFVDFLDLVRVTLELDWLLLSKRIGNWRKRLQEALDWLSTPERMPDRFALVQWLREWLDGKAPANVWIGSTVVNQEEADRDVPKLLQVPARVRFLSIEPMLGPIDIRFAFSDAGVIRCPRCMFGTNRLDHGPCPNDGETLRNDPGVHWIICGGESGPSARPMHPEWARSLRDQCKAAGVPFLFKQWGEWSPVEDIDDNADGTVNIIRADGSGVAVEGRVTITREHDHDFAKVGKHEAGRHLDGVTHTEFPEIS